MLIKKQGLDPEILKNYRPVSNLSFISKIIEKAIATQIHDHLINNDIVDNFQCCCCCCCSPSETYGRKWGNSNFQILTELPVPPQAAGVVGTFLMCLIYIYIYIYIYILLSTTVSHFWTLRMPYIFTRSPFFVYIVFNFQSTYKVGHSCETALLRVYNDIVTTIGRGNGDMLVLLNL